jgi:hypothetical protein
VRLELRPSEIAFVYRKGLAHGAEVCRRGTHEWRPLVTTPELREALAKRASLAEMIEVAEPAALTLNQTLAITDPTLAALFLARRPQLPKTAPPPPPGISKSVPPPPLVPKSTRPPPLLSQTIPPPPRLPQSEPPPSLVFTTDAELVMSEQSALVRTDSIPDWEDTPLMPLQLKTIPPTRRAVAFAQQKMVHARPLELSLVATVAVLATLAITALTLHAEAPRLNALVSSHVQGDAAAPSTQPATLPVPLAPPAIPVVFLRDLPVEGRKFGGATAPAAAHSAYSARSPQSESSGPNRAALARALGGAAAAARSCGAGPVNAQVVVTFAPSGVARSIHFASPPPVPLRTCVLNAISRTRITPFQGEPVTVSKTLRW